MAAIIALLVGCAEPLPPLMSTENLTVLDAEVHAEQGDSEKTTAVSRGGQIAVKGMFRVPDWKGQSAGNATVTILAHHPKFPEGIHMDGRTADVKSLGEGRFEYSTTLNAPEKNGTYKLQTHFGKNVISESEVQVE